MFFPPLKRIHPSEREEDLKKKTFPFSITPAPSPSPSYSQKRGEEVEGGDVFQQYGTPSLSNSLSNVLAATFMHETQKWIESIQWALRH